jgi:hypothetical protein
MSNEFNLNLLTTEDSYNNVFNSLKNKMNGRYLRFGDGDFNLARGEADMLSAPTQELQVAFFNIFKNLKESDFISVNFHCKEYNMVENGMKPGIHETSHSMASNCLRIIKYFQPNIKTIYSHIFLHHVMVENPSKFKKMIDLISENSHSLILHSNTFDSFKLSYWFGCHYSVTCSPSNSFSEKNRILNDIASLKIDNSRYLIVILAMGCGGRAMIDDIEKEIQKKTNTYFIFDIGSPIDALMGFPNTRAWIEMTTPDLSKLASISY